MVGQDDSKDGEGNRDKTAQPWPQAVHSECVEKTPPEPADPPVIDSEQKPQLCDDQASATASEAGKTEQSIIERLKFRDWLLVIFAGVTTIFTGWSVYVFTGQWKEMQGSSEQMSEAIGIIRDNFITDQRPWIKAEFALGSDMVYSLWADGGASWYVTINVTVTNTGKTPATFVFPAWRTEQGDLHKVINDQTEMCGRADPRSAAQAITIVSRGFGNTIFPGQSFTWPVGDHLLMQEIDRPERPPLPELVHFFGCINYRSVLEANWHQTGFIYEIAPAHGPDGKTITSRDGRTILKGNLALVPQFQTPQGFFVR